MASAGVCAEAVFGRFHSHACLLLALPLPPLLWPLSPAQPPAHNQVLHRQDLRETEQPPPYKEERLNAGGRPTILPAGRSNPTVMS